MRPILPVSALTGAGLDALKAVLQDIGRRVPPRPDSGIFRMPIDRVFTMHGFGTVVAGTILGGAVRAGDRVAVYPEGLVTRVRGVQVHGSKAEASGVGRRTALNLQDVGQGRPSAAARSPPPKARSSRPRGSTPASTSSRSAARELKHRERVRLHIGTDEVMARLAVIGGPDGRARAPRPRSSSSSSGRPSPCPATASSSACSPRS